MYVVMVAAAIVVKVVVAVLGAPHLDQVLFDLILVPAYVHSSH